MRHFSTRSIAPFILAAFAFSAVPASAQFSDPEITSRDLRTHVEYLASDALEGRRSGTDANRKAAEYIADLLKKYDIAPAGENGGYYQPFTFSISVRLGEGNSCTLGTQPLALNTDYRPLGFSANGSASGQVVFAGYGISAPDKGYDDYAGLDVAGKIVVVLRWAPDGDSPRSEFARLTGFREKARVARDRGAAT